MGYVKVPIRGRLNLDNEMRYFSYISITLIITRYIQGVNDIDCQKNPAER